MTTTDPVRLCPGCNTNLAYLVGRKVYSQSSHVHVPGVYDGGLFIAHTLKNGGCGYAWHRWPKGHHLRYIASAYVDVYNRKRAAITEWKGHLGIAT